MAVDLATAITELSGQQPLCLGPRRVRPDRRAHIFDADSVLDLHRGMRVPLVYFKCPACSRTVRANAADVGHPLPCPHCGDETRCPPARAHSRWASTSGTGRSQVWLTGSAVLRVWLLGMLVLAGGWAFQVLVTQPDRPAAGDDSALSAADLRQREILRGAIDLPADPALMQVYNELNARHFHGLLPAVPVVWEPRLVEVGQLAGDAYSLEGTFGRLGDRAIVLLNPDLAVNPEAIRRALSHEMVHVWLDSIGEPSTGHGPVFQSALKRLASEGAFTGIAATAAERQALRDWLDTESARLDSMSEQARREGATLQVEAQDLERALATLGEGRIDPTSSDPLVAAWLNRRDAYNRRVEELQDRKTRHDRDVAAFNAAVERYNLMEAYPSGIDDAAAH